MRDYWELVKRLREHNGWALNETLDQAADAIEELSEDSAALNGVVTNLLEQLADVGKTSKWISVAEPCRCGQAKLRSSPSP